MIEEIKLFLEVLGGLGFGLSLYLIYKINIVNQNVNKINLNNNQKNIINIGSNPIELKKDLEKEIKMSKSKGNKDVIEEIEDLILEKSHNYLRKSILKLIPLIKDKQTKIYLENELYGHTKETDKKFDLSYRDIKGIGLMKTKFGPIKEIEIPIFFTNSIEEIESLVNKENDEFYVMYRLPEEIRSKFNIPTIEVRLKIYKTSLKIMMSEVERNIKNILLEVEQ